MPVSTCYEKTHFFLIAHPQVKLETIIIIIIIPRRVFFCSDFHTKVDRQSSQDKHEHVELQTFLSLPQSRTHSLQALWPAGWSPGETLGNWILFTARFLQ